MMIRGVGASAGIGIGRAVCVRPQALAFSQVPAGTPRQEKDRLAAAAVRFAADTSAMAAGLRTRLGNQEAEILEGQAAMIEDPVLRRQIDDAIDGGSSAEGALDAVCGQYAALFDAMDDAMMRQRAADVRDLRARMLALLLGLPRQDLSALPPGTVLVAYDLTPSMTVDLRADCVAAIVTEAGGFTSHGAILARALGLPAVLGAAGALEQLADGQTVIVDGSRGQVICAPTPAQLARYQGLQAQFLRGRQALKAYRRGPTRTADGTAVQLLANIASPGEAAAALDCGAEGIGLFRTEFLFMGRQTPPTEEEQYRAYAQAAEAMAARPVIIRTLDAGGDKTVPCLAMPAEENPFLGCRAIRYCLAHPALFKTQLRAILRAGALHGNIRLMLPLVTGPAQVRRTRALLAECRAELAAAGLPFDPDMTVGVMIETPAAAMDADLLAREADFFSIGTNDLTQYILAVDRGNAAVAELYNPFHPAVLRAIRRTARSAREAGIPVGMCGEAAADPRMLPLLLAFGLDELSVSAPSVPAVRAAAAHWHVADARALADRVMEADTADAVQGLLDDVLARKGAGGEQAAPV